MRHRHKLKNEESISKVDDNQDVMKVVEERDSYKTQQVQKKSNVEDNQDGKERVEENITFDILLSELGEFGKDQKMTYLFIQSFELDGSLKENNIHFQTVLLTIGITVSLKIFN